ncbi:MAG: MBL fold metallo-hydrolase [Desulfitobacteriaceae bacterium]
MSHQVMPDIYRIEIPIPNSPLKAVNSYIIKSPERNLIIDTGLNREICVEVMLSALKKLNIKMENTDIFITHMHADHAGMVATLSSDTSKVYCSRVDGNEIFPTNDYWDSMRKGARAHGFPIKEVENALNTHPGYKYSSSPIELSIVKNGDIIRVGDYQFRCVATPGHTKGHMCLYEPAKRLLISGDHILGNITPNVSLFRTEDGNPLHDYLLSLDKVYQLDIELVLPGHRDIISNHRKRINELKQHYLIRASEILPILDLGSMDAYTVASKMSWDIVSPSWEEFPVAQKWFATGEAIAHLKYLEEEGKVKSEIINDINIFSLI